MNKIAFVVQPFDTYEVCQRYPTAGCIPGFLMRQILRYLPPFKTSDVSISLSGGKHVRGWVITCPLTIAQMSALPEEIAADKVIQAGKAAQRAGAEIIGLGGYIPATGRIKNIVQQGLNVRISAGCGYTISAAVEGMKLAAEKMGHDLNKARVVVIGATEFNGSVCAHMVARKVKNLLLVGDDKAKLNKVAHNILYDTGLAARIEVDIRLALRNSDIVLLNGFSVDGELNPGDFKPRALICDIFGSKLISQTVADAREDLTVIEGGLVEVPGEVRFSPDVGLPEGLVYPWMAEAIIQAQGIKCQGLDSGDATSVRQIDNITKLAKKFNFKVVGFAQTNRIAMYKKGQGFQKSAAKFFEKLTG